MRIRGPTAPMHLGLKEQDLCALLLVSPVISRGAARQMSERPLSVKGGIMDEKWPIIFSLQCDFRGNCWGFLHAAKLRHGTDGFTSPLKEGMLRNFSPEKSDGFGWVWTRELGVPEASMPTTRPRKPLRQPEHQHISAFLPLLHSFFQCITSWNPQGLSRPVMGLLYLFLSVHQLQTSCCLFAVLLPISLCLFGVITVLCSQFAYGKYVLSDYHGMKWHTQKCTSSI
jgi:hypothetical protein